MSRNLFERVEVMFPLKETLLRERLHHEILDAYMADNVKARLLVRDGVYLRPWQMQKGKRQLKPPTGAQAELL